MTEFRTLGIIGKFQPPTRAHEMLISAAMRRAGNVRIGIGSVNRHDAQHPFHPYEIKEMIERIVRPLGGSYRIVGIPDYGHIPGNEDGQAWKAHMIREFAGIDALVTGNPYVTLLLQDTYRIITPEEIIAPATRLPICGSLVRSSMALGMGWTEYVPVNVALYLQNLNIPGRVQREFGEELRASFPTERETVDGERRKIGGG